MVGSTANMFKSLLKETHSAHADTNEENESLPTYNPSPAPAPAANELGNMLKNMMGNAYNEDNTPMS